MDAGGSTTTAILPGSDERRTYGSVNPASVGAEAAARTQAELFGDVAAALDGRPGAGWIATAAVDLTGGEEETLRLGELARVAGVRGRLLISNDAMPWLVAPPLSGRGVVLVCGTGSGFVAADGESVLCRVGGCEYLGSDEASAFALGLAGLRAAVRAADGRGPATAIGARLTGLTGAGSPAELARELAAEAFPEAAVAAIAPAVCDAWLDGDEPAAELVFDAVGELVLGVRAARDRAGLTGEWSVAAGGGVLLGCPPLLSELDRRLRAELSVAEVVAASRWRPCTPRCAAVRAGPPGAVRTLDLDPPPLPSRPPVRGAPATGTFDYGPMVAAHRDAGADLTIGVQRIERRFVRLFGMVEVEADLTVRRLVEKPADPTSDLVFTAFCLFRAEALEEVLTSLASRGPDGWQHDISRDVLPNMIAEGRHLLAYPISGYWADIGTVKRYHLEQLRLLDRPGPLPPEDLPRTLTGAPPRYVPGLDSLVGDGADVAAGAEVRSSVLFPDCVVEPGATVERSVVLPGARVRAGVRLSGAVTASGEDVNGPRTGLADLEPA